MKPLLALLCLSTPLLAEVLTDAKIVVYEESFTELIDPAAEVEKLADGFGWAEGPVWDEPNNRLLFTDVPGNTAYSWTEADGKQVFLQPSGFSGPIGEDKPGGANGLAYNEEGELLMCEHGDRRLSKVTKHGSKITLADHFQGKRLNSPNDLDVSSDGTIYFTDPPYGLKGGEENPHYEQSHNGVYRLSPDGTLTLEVADLIRPNGIALSLDEKSVFVAQSHEPEPYIMRYPIAEDGSLGEGKIFFNCQEIADQGPGGADGLKLDEQGNLWITGPGGVTCISPEGKKLGAILPNSRVANITFGEDGKSLFLTAHQRLLKVRTKVSGAK